jgi:hypothetical protein
MYLCTSVMYICTYVSRPKSDANHISKTYTTWHTKQNTLHTTLAKHILLLSKHLLHYITTLANHISKTSVIIWVLNGDLCIVHQPQMLTKPIFISKFVRYLVRRSAIKAPVAQ